MKILVPLIEWERRRSAPRLVFSRPRSVPQCGSVRHMVPVHSPLTGRGNTSFCHASPYLAAPRSRAVREQRELPRQVRGVDHLLDRHADRDAADPVRPVPAATPVPASRRRRIAGRRRRNQRRRHAPSGRIEPAADLVADLVDGEHGFVETRAFVQHRVDDVARLRGNRVFANSASESSTSCSAKRMSSSGPC